MPSMATTLLGLTLALVGLPVIAIVSGLFGAKAPFAAHMLSVIAIAGVTTAICVMVTQWERQPLSSIGLKLPTLPALLIGIAIAAAFIFAIGPLLMKVPSWLDLPGFEEGILDAARFPLWYLVITILVVASAEEVLYRGYAIEHLNAITGNLWPAIAISVAMFGLAHVPMWGWGPSLTTVISGAIFAVLYVWLRDLTPLIVAHILIDLAGLALPRLSATTP